MREGNLEPNEHGLISEDGSLGVSVDSKNIYHLLCGTLGQCVSITQIIDLDVFDVVPIRNVHITVDVAGARACVWIWRG